MRNIFLSLIILFFATPALAADTTSSPASLAASTTPLKIGVIDVRMVVQKSAQLRTINATLTRHFKPREQAIIEAQANYKAKQEKYAKTAQSLSDTERSNLEHEIINDRAGLQAMITSFQQDLDNEQNSAMQKLLSQIASIVNSIAAKEHYDLILQADNAPFVADRLNISSQVLAQLSNQN